MKTLSNNVKLGFPSCYLQISLRLGVVAVALFKQFDTSNCCYQFVHY